MEQQIIKIDDEQFGKLIELPQLYEKNLKSAQAAFAAADLQCRSLEIVDVTKIENFEGFAAPLNDLLKRLNLTLKTMEDARKPHTSKMDAIKSLFTATEATVKSCVANIKAQLIRLETEKARRNKEREAKMEQLSLDEAFDHAVAVPVETAQKGTSTKLKYQPATLKHWQDIAKLWFIHDFNPDKLSFMLTAANKRISTTLLDVPTVEDISIRAI